MDRKFEQQFTLWGASYFERLRWYKLPNIRADIFASAKLGAANSVIGVVVSEWLSGENGLGYIATIAMYQYDTPRLFAAVFCSIALSLLFYSIVRLFEINLRKIERFIDKLKIKRRNLLQKVTDGYTIVISFPPSEHFNQIQSEAEIIESMLSLDVDRINKAIGMALWIPTPKVQQVAKKLWTEKENLINNNSKMSLAKLLSYSQDPELRKTALSFLRENTPETLKNE